jgi:hypothetical protein
MELYNNRIPHRAVLHTVRLIKTITRKFVMVY